MSKIPSEKQLKGLATDLNSKAKITVSETPPEGNLAENEFVAVPGEIRETTLFDNSIGKAGTIALSDSVVNYEQLEIFYFGEQDYYGSVRVDRPKYNKNVQLTAFSNKAGTDVRFSFAVILIANSTITFKDNGVVDLIGNNVVRRDIVFITKVVGYKK